MCHSATVWANAIMHAGTGVDAFLRTNLEWLAKATNWAKFGATAGLGVIQRGSVADGRSRSLLSPYLPAAPGSSTGSPYSEGGALYALGLIHANSAQGAQQLLIDSLRATQHEVGERVGGVEGGGGGALAMSCWGLIPGVPVPKAPVHWEASAHAAPPSRAPLYHRRGACGREQDSCRARAASLGLLSVSLTVCRSTL